MPQPVTTEERLREIYGPPMPRAVAKELTALDRHCRAFIALSPMMLLATSDGTRMDVSPKGDAPGFVQVESDSALLLPDWPGNGRIDGLRNILRHPRVGAIFLVPNVKETLRVNGAASIHDDPALLARFEHKGRLPLTVLRIEVEEAFLHCAKAFLRSGLWSPESWPERSALPTMGQMLVDHVKGMDLGEAATETEAEMSARYAKMLY